MSLGTSIFLSAVLLSIVALYIATKDRWNWKKILLWPFLGVIILLILVGVGFYIINTIRQQPRPQNVFWGISLNSRKEDITFSKGIPTAKLDDAWFYEFERSHSKENYSYVIQFKDDKIQYVSYFGAGGFMSPRIMGMGRGDTYGELIQKFGDPSRVDRSEDELERIVSFDKYNVFFFLTKNRVTGYGIYNSTFGPMEVAKTKNKIRKKSK